MAHAKQEILINASSYEVRIATLEDGQLKDLHIERANQQGMIGNIYKGKVERLVPGMQAAFLNIGAERSAFLHLSDLCTPPSEKQDIRDFLREGQEIIVQVYKDALGTKGARLTTYIGIPSRYLVFTPNTPEITISQKIKNSVERERLKNLLSNTLDKGGYIVRTATEFANSDDVLADQIFLNKIWQDICSRAKNAKAGEIIYAELPIELRLIRDLSIAQIEKICVDNEKSVLAMRAFAKQYIPPLCDKIEFYNSRLPIFELYSIDESIQKLLERKVNLKSGGYLIFDQTEAMTTIDVNTGSFLGRNNNEETIYQTNLEAIKTIALQMRLRNLGGIIIIDLIDMSHPLHREKILKSFNNEIAKDPARVEIHELTTLGLLQVTRKRIRESLEHVLCDSCPTCEGIGFIKSVQTICYDIFREMKRLDTIYAWEAYLIKASPEVITYLQNDAANYKADLESVLDKLISLQVDSQYRREQFSVLPHSSR